MAINLDGFKVGLDELLKEKATSPHGCVLPPVSETVSLWTPVAGEHGWEVAVALMPCLWVSG